MPYFKLTVKHDNGTVNIKTFASDPEAAAYIVMQAENCPRRAITKIVDLTPPKVKLLIEAINRANEAARIAGEANPDDGGTCNFDSVVIKLPRWKQEEINAVVQATGTTFSDPLSSRWFKGYRFLRTKTAGQGMLRTRMTEAAYKSLKEASPALDIRMYYQAD